MGGFSDLWNSLLDGLATILRSFHGWLEPIAGVYSWGLAIVLLTVAVRILLLPLAVKQINSMRATQKLQPEMTKIRKKYKVDRSLLKTDPEKYRAQRQKQQEAMMALYKEHNVNPAASCLPLIAQAPIFIALYSLLGDTNRMPEFETAPFLLVDSLAALPAQAGIGAFILLLLMGLTTFWSQRQMMASNPAMQDQPQQKVLLYVMPVVLTVFGWNLQVGILIYWVTTQFWTMGQQWIMFRNVEHALAVNSKNSAGGKAR